MAQGAVKPKASKSKSKTLHSNKQKQKSTSNRVIKPKDYKKAQAQEMSRRGAAGMTGNLEKMLAERAGHTEMIKSKQGQKKGTGLGNAGKSSAGMGAGKKVLGKK